MTKHLVSEPSAAQNRDADRNADSGQVARNGLASYLSLVTAVLTGLLVTPVLFRSLGENRFGTYALMASLVGYVALLEAGTGTSTVRAVAMSHGDPERIRTVLASSRALYVPIIVLCSIAYVPLLVFAPSLHGASGISATDTRIVLLAMAVGQLGQLAIIVYPAYLIGTGRSDVMYAVGVGGSLLVAVSQVLVVLLGGQVVGLAITTALIGTVAALTTASIARRRLGYHIRLASRDGPTRRHLFIFGLQNAGVSLQAMLSQQSDVVIVGFFFAPSRVAAYAVASRAAGVAKTLASNAMGVLVPTFAHGAQAGDDRRQLRLAREGILLGSIALLPVPLIAVFFGDGLLRLWIGSAPPDTSLVLAVLTLTACVQVTGGMAYSFFSGRGDLRLFLRIGVVATVVNVIVSVLSVPIVGIVGPALGTLAACVGFDLLVLPRAFARALNGTVRELVAPVVRVMAPTAVIAILVAFVAHQVLGTDEAQAVVGSVATALAAYSTAILAAGAERRNRYKAILGSVFA
jgi:O-antigen/teichoic acid export membrane protein